MARDVKKNKKGFYRYTNQQIKVIESVPFLRSESGELVSTDEKTEVLENILPQSSLATSLLTLPKSINH